MRLEKGLIEILKALKDFKWRCCKPDITRHKHNSSLHKFLPHLYKSEHNMKNYEGDGQKKLGDYFSHPSILTYFSIKQCYKPLSLVEQFGKSAAQNCPNAHMHKGKLP